MRDKYGGQVIGSGGYGCVFLPALKCKDSDTRTSGISKLLFNNDAKIEWKEISGVKKIIEKIPNNQNYFLLGNMTMCEPDKLDKSDMVGILGCSSLSRYKINASNINKNLQNFKSINMPDGGKDIAYMFSASNTSFEVINNSMIMLLNNGIVPMNRLKLLHNDLKGENILYKDEFSRIIDWGLASKINGTSIPKRIMSHVIQFNLPFSNILFTKYFNNIYPKILNQSFIQDKNKYRIAAEEWFNNNNYIGSGHVPYINHSILMPIIVTINPSTVVRDTNNYLISLFNNYIGIILEKYTDHSNPNKPVFSDKKYFNEVYRHNCDVWGFIMSYSTLLKSNYFFVKHKNEKIGLLHKQRIAELILKYCYNPYYAINPINVTLLSQDLYSLNKNFNNEILSSYDIQNIYNGIPVKPFESKEYIIKIDQPVTILKKIYTNKNIKRSRCPNGTIRNKKTGECESNNKTAYKKVNSSRQKLPINNKIKHGRCPNGTRRNKKTGDCDRKIR